MRRVLHLGIACSLAAGSWTVASAEPASAASCRRALVVGVRGSGETAKDFKGLGETVSLVVKGFTSTVRKSTSVEVRALDYASRAILSPDTFLRPGLFIDSAQEGIGTLGNLLLARARTCPKQALVLIGFSQGALVVNRTLVELDRQYPEVLGRVASVTLIADPQRIGTSPYVTGTANPTWPGLTLANRLYPADDLPTFLWPRVESYCTAGDLVCAWDPTVGLVDAALGALTSGGPLEAHGTYKRTGIATEAGTRAARRLDELLRLTRSKA